MASITTRDSGPKAGTSTLTFYHNGKPSVIYLGKVKQTTADTIKLRVEFLLSALQSGAPIDPDTARWLGKIDDGLHAKLAKVGLAEPRQTTGQDSTAALGLFIDQYINNLDVKDSTLKNLELARGNLVEFFGEDKPLTNITAGDADDFRRWLGREPKEGEPVKESGKGLDINTVRRRSGRAKQFFRAAVRKKLITESPFADMKDTNVKANRERDFFVTREAADKVLAACPNDQWKLLFAPSRFGGLRCVSEHTHLRWSDVDWEGNRFTVYSPKTEHHEGGDKREVPIFPELLPYLKEAKALAAKGAEYVITMPVVDRFRKGATKSCDLATGMKKIIRQAGLEVWPKVYQNLRSTRQTELTAQGHPEHVVCQWIGNSKAVAREHYLRVTEADFAKAIASAEGSVESEVRSEVSPKNGQSQGHMPAVAEDSLLLQIVQKVLENKGSGHVGAIVGKALQHYERVLMGLH